MRVGINRDYYYCILCTRVVNEQSCATVKVNILAWPLKHSLSISRD